MEEASETADNRYGDAAGLHRKALLLMCAVVALVGVPLLAVGLLGKADPGDRDMAVLMILNGSALFAMGCLLLAFPFASLRMITDMYRQWPEQFWRLTLFKSDDEPSRSRRMGALAYVAFAGGFAGGGLAALLAAAATLSR